MTFATLFFALASLEPTAAKGEVPIFLSKELGITALSDAAAALARPLADAWDVKVGGGKKRHVKTCLDFLAVSKTKFDLENPVDWPVWSEQGTRCFALDALKAAKPAKQTYLGWFRMAKPEIGKLPPGLAMLDSLDDEDEAAAAAKACRGWGKFDPSLKVRAKGIDQATLRSEGWTGQLVLYARADVDGDGLEDLLLRRDAHATGGSAALFQVFVVTQPSASACARVVRTMGASDGSDSP